ncbi:hypothetical protein P7K49_033646 [Saguinus oedipus]|uniref:Uncharacterized protein n=1 Tax=Saguinus oedipus TaxID=9490 RepID=A0ABQ9TSI3_SAGOE|nr:hypothetical protein P7K49_033646 [Saguinus oedipus]
MPLTSFLSLQIRWEKNITLGEPPGFLHSWWWCVQGCCGWAMEGDWGRGRVEQTSSPDAHSVFWDLYCAAPDRREACEHSGEAKAFQDYVRGGAGSAGGRLEGASPAHTLPTVRGSAGLSKAEVARGAGGWGARVSEDASTRYGSRACRSPPGVLLFTPMVPHCSCVVPLSQPHWIWGPRGVWNCGLERLYPYACCLGLAASLGTPAGPGGRSWQVGVNALSRRAAVTMAAPARSRDRRAQAHRHGNVGRAVSSSGMIDVGGEGALPGINSSGPRGGREAAVEPP